MVAQEAGEGRQHHDGAHNEPHGRDYYEQRSLFGEGDDAEGPAKGEGDPHGGDKEKEDGVIAAGDADPYPGAVVIHPVDAAVAGSAMSGAGRAVQVAGLAPLEGFGALGALRPRRVNGEGHRRGLGGERVEPDNDGRGPRGLARGQGQVGLRGREGVPRRLHVLARRERGQGLLDLKVRDRDPAPRDEPGVAQEQNAKLQEHKAHQTPHHVEVNRGGPKDVKMKPHRKEDAKKPQRY